MVGNTNEIITWLLTKNKDDMFEIKYYKKKRSLDSNAYCWILCQKIAEVIKITKEEVYRKSIKDIGQFEILPIKNEAVETFIKAWTSKGIGWVCENLNKSKLDGYTNIVAYYGSSIYNNHSMSLLINGLVEECRSLNIETMKPEELAILNGKWK
jgi:hypothetical protein